MSIPVVVQRPAKFSFTKNKILWRFFMYNPTEDGCQLDFKIIVTNVQQTSTPITYQLQATPGSDGYVNIFIQDIVDSFIKYEIPSITGGAITLASNTLAGQIQFRRISTIAPNTDWVGTETLRYFIKGGIEQLQADYNNYFESDAGKKPWATWQPDKTFVGIQDRFFLSMMLNDTNLDDRVLVITPEWTDGTSDSITVDIIPFATAFTLFHVNAGYYDLGLDIIAAGRKLWRYSLKVIKTADSTQYGNAYFYYIDYRTFYKVKVFNYFNSLGGIDHIRLLGEQQNDYTRAFTEGEQYSGSVIIGSPDQSQYLQTNNTRLSSFKSDAGYRHTSREMEAFQEIFTSGLIWEILNTIAHYGKSIQVWVTGKSGTIKKNSDKRFGFPLEWRYGFAEPVYTPGDVDLGDATNAGEEYTALSCPIPTSVGIAAIEGRPSVLFWDTGGNGISVLEYKLVTDADWIIINPALPGYNYNALPAGTYNWRVKTICAEGFESNYVNGTNFGI